MMRKIRKRGVQKRALLASAAFGLAACSGGGGGGGSTAPPSPPAPPPSPPPVVTSATVSVSRQSVGGSTVIANEGAAELSIFNVTGDGPVEASFEQISGPPVDFVDFLYPNGFNNLTVTLPEASDLSSQAGVSGVSAIMPLVESDTIVTVRVSLTIDGQTTDQDIRLDVRTQQIVGPSDLFQDLKQTIASDPVQGMIAYEFDPEADGLIIGGVSLTDTRDAQVFTSRLNDAGDFDAVNVASFGALASPSPTRPVPMAIIDVDFTLEYLDMVILDEDQGRLLTARVGADSVPETPQNWAFDTRCGYNTIGIFEVDDPAPEPRYEFLGLLVRAESVTSVRSAAGGLFQRTDTALTRSDFTDYCFSVIGEGDRAEGFGGVIAFLGEDVDGRPDFTAARETLSRDDQAYVRSRSKVSPRLVPGYKPTLIEGFSTPDVGVAAFVLSHPEIADRHAVYVAVFDSVNFLSPEFLGPVEVDMSAPDDLILVSAEDEAAIMLVSDEDPNALIIRDFGGSAERVETISVGLGIDQLEISTVDGPLVATIAAAGRERAGIDIYSASSPVSGAPKQDQSIAKPAGEKTASAEGRDAPYQTFREAVLARKGR